MRYFETTRSLTIEEAIDFLKNQIPKPYRLKESEDPYPIAYQVMNQIIETCPNAKIEKTGPGEYDLKIVLYGK